MAWIAAALACAPVAAQQPGLRLPARSDEGPAFLSAQRIEGIGQQELTAEGDAHLQRGDASISADSLHFNNETSEVQAKGHVRLEKAGNVMTGPSLLYRTTTSSGMLEKPEFVLAPHAARGMKPVTGRGRAEHVDLQDETHAKLFDAFFTTCPPDREDWYIHMDELDLDTGADVGKAKWPTVYFKDFPLLKSPYLDFPLQARRKSGFLAPTIGVTGKNGPEVAVPYYFNLAPNYDLTLTPRYMAKRGLQVATETRYLEQTYNGVLQAEVLPNDPIRGGRRDAVALTHVYASGPVSAAFNLNRVSDDNYFRDLSTRISSVSQTYLPRDGQVNYTGMWWDGGTWTATTRMQSFQVLQDPNNPLPIPYARRPQVLLNAAKFDARGFDFRFTGEAVDFTHPTQVNGVRTIANPSIAFPYTFPGAYVTPKLGLHATTYNLTNPASGTDSTLQRNLPIFSTDAGLVLEKQDQSWFGQSYLQTLEPRAYYLYIPFRNQDAIPIFDTAVADINYAQIFSENRFVGGDRVNDANEVTFALTSRLLSPRTGQEAVRAAIAHRYAFRPQRVTLAPGTAPQGFSESDWLASLAGRVAPRWTVETAVQYNAGDLRTDRMVLSARYQPDIQRLLNMSYRYLRDQFNQVDVSGQWPLVGGWYGVGRYNFSVSDHRVIESLAGFEYNGGCWVSRVVMQRFATAAGVATNAVFLQLELGGFGSLGSNPLEALRRNIPGYTRMNQVVAPGRAFDFEY